MNHVAPSLAGSTIGRYRLIDKLGQGGMATVYRAEDPSLGREVAIKVMHPFIAERSDMSARFEREAKLVAGLRHPSVMQLHDYAPATGEHPAYLVMELLTGPSLQRFLVEHGAPLAEVAAMVGLRVAQALSAAHARGIVHRDVKPENVMFDRGAAKGSELPPSVRVVLCDFGIARIATAEGMTATGAIMGSPAYMSPEQASGAETDARSDQFSLGAVLYQLATGSLPFSAPSPLATMAKIVSGEHRPPTAKNARVPQYLERVIERCLSITTAARFPSADAVAEALREGLAADGFNDVDGELAAYVRDPAGYNAKAGPRIIDAALAQAERAAKNGQRPRALAAASRVLSWDPRNPRALALADAAAPVRARRVILALAPILLLVSGGAWWMRFHRPPPSHSSTLLPVKSTTAAPTKPVVVVTAPAPIANLIAQAPSLPSSPSPSASGEEAKARAPKHHHPAATDPIGSIATTTAADAPSTKPVIETMSAPTVTAPVKPAADAPATLAVAIAPWCDLTVDGKARGRTPQTLALPPGKHHLECRNPSSGQALARDIELAPGESQQLRERLYATVRVTPQLTRGDALSIDGDEAAAAARQVAPGRRRITLLAAGKELETRYIDVPPAGCRLVDKPELHCEKP